MHDQYGKLERHVGERVSDRVAFGQLFEPVLRALDVDVGRELVERDVMRGYVSKEAAARDYGVTFA